MASTIASDDGRPERGELHMTLGLDQQLYGLAATYVVQVLPAPKVSRVSGAPPHIRGLMTFRGRVVPLLDLRARLGLTSALADREAFAALMTTREQDHRDWLAALRLSVTERSVFTKTTDPHQCAFGRWYDAFHTTDPWITNTLARFDSPHQRIHRLAVEVKACQARGDHAAAAALVEGTGASLLQTMVELFTDLRRLIQDEHREVVMVLDLGGRLLGAIVDEVRALQRLTAEPVPHHALGGNNTALLGLGRDPAGKIVPLIAPGALLEPGLLEALSQPAAPGVRAASGFSLGPSNS